jgi:hypothetical protein
MNDVMERLAQWARTVDEVERGYALTFDDYLNDLDVRHALRVIDDTHAQYGVLATLDARFRAASFPSGSCVWGEDNAEAEGWDRERHWYYWRLPTHPGPAFHDEEPSQS